MSDHSRAQPHSSLTRADFTRQLLHEIHGPLATIRAHAEELAERLSGDHEELVRGIVDSARRLTVVVGRFDDLIPEEQPEERYVMDVVPIVRGKTQELRRQAEAGGLELVFRADDAPALARILPAHVRRIVSNLVDNALRYTEEGTVEVSVEARDGRVWIYVADTGRGMKAALRDRAFEPFVRGEQSTDAHPGGTGLGLTITESLVRALNGQIFICSTPGSGSTVTVHFPEAREE